MKRFNLKGLLLACVAVSAAGLSWTSSGAEWSGAVSLPAGTLDEAVTVTGETTVEVASGIAYLTGGISGSAKITKTGAGELFIVGGNTGLTSPIQIDAGYLVGSNTCALGTGKITISGQREGFTGDCGLKLWGVGTNSTEVLTYGNEINVTGNTTMDHPALLLFGQNVMLTGKITAAEDFVFYDDDASAKAIYSVYWDRAEHITSCTFGEIAAGGAIRHSGWTKFVFGDKVTAQAFVAEDERGSAFVLGSNRNATYNFLDTVDVVAFTNVRNVVTLGAPNAFDGLSYALARSAVQNGIVNMNGFAQRISSVESEPMSQPDQTRYLSIRNTAGGNSAMLTIDGGRDETPRTHVACVAFCDNLSLTVDAPDGFVQVVSNRVCTMSGSIAVRGGTFVVGGGSTFSNVTSVTVSEGAAFVEESGVVSLPKLKTLTVDGTLRLPPSALTSNQVDLVLGKNAKLELPVGETLPVKTLSWNGGKAIAGAWTHEELSAIPEGVTVWVETSPDNPQSGGVTAVWTGAVDEHMENLGNWTVNEVVPGSLDLTSGKTIVRIDSGSAMVPTNGMRVNRIINNRPDGPSVKPFVIGAEGRTLVVDGFMMSKQTYPVNPGEAKSQIVIRGEIIGPGGLYQGPSVNSVGGFTFVYQAPGTVTTSEVIRETDKGGMPLVLDGVTFGKPIYLWVAENSTVGEAFYALPNTTNVISDVQISGNNKYRMTVGANAVVTMRKWIGRSMRPVKAGEGTLRITGKITGERGLEILQGRLELDAVDCTFGAPANENRGIGMGKNGDAELAFARSSCIADDDKEQLDLTGSHQILVDFGVTTQRFSRVLGANTHADSVLTGEHPAMLEIKGGSAVTNTGCAFGDIYNQIQMTGGLGVHYLGNGPASETINVKAGSEETFKLKGQDFASCGDLAVSGGTLQLASDATWLNGTNFTARGTGVLEFTAAGQVGKKIARVHFADDGQIKIKSGVTVRVAAADVDGSAVPAGTYTKDSTGLMAGRIVGDGTLRIVDPNAGLILIFR